MSQIIPLINCLSAVLNRKELNQLGIIIQAMLTMRGRITMKGLSRWSENGGSYSSISRFFHTKIDWLSLNWFIIKSYMPFTGDFILAADEVVVTKSGKETFGVGQNFSSIQNQIVQSIIFLNISLIQVETGKAWSLLMKQIIKENKSGCSKDKEKKNKKNKKKRKVGRPKGSKNKNKKNVELSPYLKFVQECLNKVLNLIKKSISIIYLVFDGEFGNNISVQMVRQLGIHLISKLRYDSALYFLYSGDNKKCKYGSKIDYDNLPEEYLKETKTDKKKNIKTEIYQMTMLHRLFADRLNIVIIVRTYTKTNSKSHVILFSTDLNLGFEKLIKYYKLRFKIEFLFRDAKQHWGLEDFMNIREKAVDNFANLSTFMVNFSYVIRQDLGNVSMGIINLKAHFHGIKYVKEVLKLLPEIPDAILLKSLYQKITSIGAIKNEEKAA